MVRGSIAAVVAVLVLGGAGCGGDETASTTSTGGGEPASPLTFTKTGGIAGVTRS